MYRGGAAVVAIVCFALMAGGCASTELQSFVTPLNDIAQPGDAKLVDEAKLQFTEGNFGNAVDAYAKTVEKNPLNPEAWLGLAASYDQIGRFDQADMAYGKVQELIGPTPSVLNNLGYSYMLRGNLDQSRTTLLAAHRGDPGNPYILNNIEMLNEKLAQLGKPAVTPN